MKLGKEDIYDVELEKDQCWSNKLWAAARHDSRARAVAFKWGTNIRVRAASLDYSSVFYSLFNQAYILNVHSGATRCVSRWQRTQRANSPGGQQKHVIHGWWWDRTLRLTLIASSEEPRATVTLLLRTATFLPSSPPLNPSLVAASLRIPVSIQTLLIFFSCSCAPCVTRAHASPPTALLIGTDICLHWSGSEPKNSKKREEKNHREKRVPDQ